MRDVILLIAEIVNMFHDQINEMSDELGLNLSDKDLHLWVFGILGIISFLIVHQLFKALARYSITVISFIYTFTVLIVIVFAVEIQQKITGRGNMEFVDAVIGLWGFLLFFLGYLVLKLGILWIRKLMKK
ncbi:hypothetical protein [Bacillus sp. T33-2]|uniref:hypothetical protein n=1 Tax=Bacillus sp. T33-2 TaxID=2054168 RepID=UPI000C77E6A5|nr:hypothetical protein [Bacillus sp. T33-2]PLR95968.1 hypothetical protein CVD19_13195 [Bacillus sp. T33-2]